MSKKIINLRGIVLLWTVLITTFFWTSTMRLLLKPEISSWRIMGLEEKEQWTVLVITSLCFNIIISFLY